MIVNNKKKKKKLSRYIGLNLVMFLIFGIIISKLVYLQIYKYEDYKERADIGSTRFVAEKAPRGKILDSSGNVLATNVQTYALTYTTTEESEKDFYTTMDNIFKILNDGEEQFKDDLMLKIDSNGKFYFDFKTDVKADREAAEILFKRDRGLNEQIEKKLFGDKKGDLTDEDIAAVNKELLKITPEETFYALVKTYNMYELINKDPSNEQLKAYINMSGKDMTLEILNKFSATEIRNYMVVKDAIKIQSFKGYRAVTIASNIKQETAFVVYQKLNDLPGIDVSLEPIRSYPYGNLASSVLGYISPINSAQEKKYDLRGYDVSSDLIGVAGIEAAFESQLKGSKGGTTIKVNSKGRKTEELFKLESYPGNNIHLTIDKDIQYAAQESLKDIINKVNTMVDFNGATYPAATRGATVAIEVKTGRILALASYPDYDPNMFAVPGGLSAEDSKKYFSPDYEEFYKEYVARTNASATLDELFPEEDGVRKDDKDIYPRSFFNYATQGLIPPGSSFKPLTALAGLQEGVVTGDTIMDDTGIWNIHKDIFGDYAPTNYAKIGHGPIDIRKALEVSSNFYFYETGFRLYEKYGSTVESLDTIAKYAYKFGLGLDANSNMKPETGVEIEENFGQVYNFKSFKEGAIHSAMFSLVDFLEKGTYGAYNFIPFDIKKLEDDAEDLKNAKQELKDKVTKRLEQVGTNEKALGADEFSADIQKEIKNVMKASAKYKENVKNYENSNNKTVDLDREAKIIGDAIAQFTVFDQASAITSPAEIVNAAIGQGISRFTPLQLANYMATLANGGTRNKVRLVDKITSPTGEVIQEFNTEVLEKIDIDPQNLQIIKEGMYRVNHVDSSSFVVQQFGNFPIPTAGKTGTADFLNTQEAYDYIGRDPYATYGSFAPVDDPEIATFTVLYDGGRGSYSSFPTKAIYEAYFKDRLLQMDPNYGEKSETFKKYVLNSTVKDNKDTQH
ncbi:penicillin-binding transpeptidase domain-containing protein [Clostridium septicum]|uniref:Penicillin-binding protein n=2 Tax=Clostridium septicum TaxID=1504 RepID=A0A9N7PKV4_CLOSE|nr:penicillin-binding transpeptidase domain-containing protein [Clostridium septicum]AYE33197.1 penicillin-binding protein [Clostridium septicum]MDU1315106.1 penicillin-binding transpeptidase domain-containing protein [Clostridium septicum]QAS61367.1 penicillin-binding protein [Clostridium septicum]UEC22201.1 penicillin-binding protein [Clostridium septicum]USR99770.1 penicillin-binding transpeptidase domain-containing protein [Clostridium septicum]